MEIAFNERINSLPLCVVVIAILFGFFVRKLFSRQLLLSEAAI